MNELLYCGIMHWHIFCVCETKYVALGDEGLAENAVDGDAELNVWSQGR
jgi:hypothetical protein